jgi:hypothetical protein
MARPQRKPSVSFTEQHDPSLTRLAATPGCRSIIFGWFTGSINGMIRKVAEMHPPRPLTTCQWRSSRNVDGLKAVTFEKKDKGKQHGTIVLRRTAAAEVEATGRPLKGDIKAESSVEETRWMSEANIKGR